MCGHVVALEKKTRKGKDITCQQPWTWTILDCTKSTTKAKKEKVVQEINKLGYNIDNLDTKMKSRYFKHERKKYVNDNANSVMVVSRSESDTGKESTDSSEGTITDAYSSDDEYSSVDTGTSCDNNVGI